MSDVAACPFCASPKTIMLNEAEKAQNAGVHCLECGMTWRGQNYNKRADKAPIVMQACHGCICPPTAEQTCQGPLCPRRPVDMRAT